MTVTLRCQNCGFSFIVTFPVASPAEVNATPMVCGHCRSTRWSSHCS